MRTMASGKSGPQPAPEANAEVERLVKQFGATQGAERVAAWKALQALGEAGVSGVLDLIEREQTRRNIGYRASGLLIIAFIVGVVLVGRVALIHPAMSAFVLLFVVAWFLALLSVARNLLPSPLEKTAKTALTCFYETIEDRRATGPLLEVYGEFVDATLNTWNRLALTRLLSRMQPNEVRFLNQKQRNAMTQILQKTVSEERLQEWKTLSDERAAFLLEVLRVIPAVGDSEALYNVKRLADILPENDNHRRVQAAAKEAIPALEARMKKLDK